MKHFIAAMLVAGSVHAGEMTIGELNGFCTANSGTDSKFFCEAYILGVYAQRSYNCHVLRVAYDATFAEATGIDTRTHVRVIRNFLANDFTGVSARTVANLFTDWSNGNRSKWDEPASSAFNRPQENIFLDKYKCELKRFD